MAVERRMCCEEEALVKSFLPTLFDSDSDGEETFLVPATVDLGVLDCRPSAAKPLHVHLGKPMKKTTSSEAFSKVQAYNKRPLTELDVSVKEEQTEATSPSSQGNSNNSTQSPFSGALESSDSMDSASPFYSVLSFESSESIFDYDLIEEPPMKRQKVETSVALRQPALPVTPSSSTSFSFRAESPSPCSTMVSAQSVPSPSRLPPALMHRHSLPVQSTLSYAPGGVTTGIPVDSCTSELGKSWLPHQPMVPTKPSNAFYPGHYGSHIPSNLPAPVTSLEKISAALAEVKRAPLMASPLGLNLDKGGLANSLLALGMTLKE